MSTEQLKEKIFGNSSKNDRTPYTMEELLNNTGAIDTKKPIIIQVGGTWIPVEHAYVVGDKELNGDYEGPEEAKGCLLIDLDM